MIYALAPYSEYQESGHAWLGRLPLHWQVKPCRALFTEVRDRNSGNEPMLSVTIGREVIPQARQLAGTGKRDSSRLDKSNYKLLCPGDIAYNKMRAWQGAIGLSSLRGIISPAYIVQRPRESAFGAYFHYLSRTPAFAKEAERWSYGITSDMWSLRSEHFRMIYCAVPPAEERVAIVRFLDHANRRIGQFIRVKKKLIALLNEQKLAITHRAVTRGLNPNVELKHSGVPWLGEIPAHWNVLRSKYLFREVDSRSLRGEETHLSMSQKHGLVPSSALTERRLMSDSYAGGKLCEAGDLVLNRLKAHLGVFALAPQAGVISPDYTVLRPIAAMAPQYFEAVYRTPACRVVLRQKAKGIVQGFWRLYTDDFYDISVPVPPADDQEAIVSGLARDLVGVRMALAQAEREIALMSEYRTRLAADVVTGQLDVRAAVADLPVVEPEAALTEYESDETDIDDGEAA